MERRRLLIALAGVAALGGGLAATGFGRGLFYQALAEEVDLSLSAVQAHEQAEAGDIVLIDIRTPQEWAASGSPASGHRLDMRREDFLQALLALAGGDTGAPIALICARGVRSSRLSNALEAAGFTQVYDVPEGMLGSRAGPGWIARGLPLSAG